VSGNAVTRQLPTEGIWLQVKPGRWRHRGTELQRAQDGGTSDDRDSRITPMPLLLFEREFTSRSPAELNRESDFFNPSVFWSVGPRKRSGRMGSATGASYGAAVFPQLATSQSFTELRERMA
jgi:hypothetical protein